MTEACDEAERIVMAAVEATPDDPYPHEDRLVAALAAAIEYRGAEKRMAECSGCTDDHAHQHEIALTAVELDDALSALGVNLNWDESGTDPHTET